MNLNHGDQRLWPVYITMENQDTKTRQFQKQPKTLLLGSISIVHEQSEDANKKDKDRKAKIYYMALKTILQRTYPSIPSVGF